MNAVTILKGVQVARKWKSEKRDDKNNIISILPHANVIWMGGNENVELDPTIDNIPLNSTLDLSIECEFQELKTEFLSKQVGPDGKRIRESIAKNALVMKRIVSYRGEGANVPLSSSPVPPPVSTTKNGLKMQQ